MLYAHVVCVLKSVRTDIARLRLIEQPEVCYANDSVGPCSLPRVNSAEKFDFVP